MSKSVLRRAALRVNPVLVLIGSPLLGAGSMRRRQVLVSFQILVSFIVFGGMPRAFVVLRLLISLVRRRVVPLDVSVVVLFNVSVVSPIIRR